MTTGEQSIKLVLTEPDDHNQWVGGKSLLRTTVSPGVRLLFPIFYSRVVDTPALGA